MALVPREKQSLLFSATFSQEIRDLAAQLLHNKAVDIKKDNKMDFTPVTGDSYKKLVRSLTHRVRF
jgi:superfamily II DNA/RNA helicase